jgi:hypothetical protein
MWYRALSVKSWALCFAPVLMASSLQELRAQDPLASLFDAWKKRQADTVSINAKWTCQITFPKGKLPTRVRERPCPPEDTTVEMSRTLLLQGDRIKISEEGLGWATSVERFLPTKFVGVYDGKDSKSYYSVDPSGEFPFGTIFKDYKSGERPIGINYVFPFLMFYKPLRYGPFGRDGPFQRASCRLVSDRALIDNKRCLLVEQIVKNIVGLQKSWVWVDPEQDFAVLRFIILTGDDKTDTRLDIWYQAGQRGVIYPKGWSLSVYDQKNELREYDKATVARCVVNESIQDEDFQLTFPPGTLVGDDKNNRRYIVREGGEKRIITPEEDERGATYQQLLDSESGMAGLSQGASSRPYWRWIAASGFACTLLILVLVKLRQRGGAR